MCCGSCQGEARVVNIDWQHAVLTSALASLVDISTFLRVQVYAIPGRKAKAK